MVFTRERFGERGGRESAGLQRRDPGGRCEHLRDCAEESALAQLLCWALQRETGKGRARVPPDVSGTDAWIAGDGEGKSSRPLEDLLGVLHACHGSSMVRGAVPTLTGRCYFRLPASSSLRSHTIQHR